MLDFFQIKQHRIVFSILAILVGLVLVIFVISGIMMLGDRRSSGYGTNNQNLISFTGEGKISTKPDVAFINFSVVTQGTRVTDVQNKNSEKMNKVVEFLKSFGVEDKDIKTTNYNLYPQYTYENNRIPQIIGYQISQTLNIKVRQLDKIGEIMEKVVDMGINQVDSLYFGVENDEQLKEQARKIAIDNAKAKAEVLAEELGIKLGKLINFYENIVGYPVPTNDYKAYGMGSGGGEGSPNVQTGENEIVINVTLNYEVK
ncbi:MAG: SIMPL domain-containing protein [Patescibacteria group bacterium]